MSFSPVSIKARVYYEDTDAGGIVYYANYLKFSERCRTEWLRGSGVSQQKLLESHFGYVICDIKGKYHKSAKLDDVLTITCIPIKVRYTRITFYQQIFNQNAELLFELQCNIAYVDLNDGRPVAMPEEAQVYTKAQMPENPESYGVNL